jgi:hypothetical protein
MCWRRGSHIFSLSESGLAHVHTLFAAISRVASIVSTKWTRLQVQEARHGVSSTSQVPSKATLTQILVLASLMSSTATTSLSYVSCAASSRPRRRPSLSPLRLGSITEIPELDAPVDLNLGAESPGSILKPALTPNCDTSLVPKDDWARSGIAVHTDVPMRKRTWRSASFSEKRKNMKRREVSSVVDRDCGICFEDAVRPCKMICCGKLFCLEHISDWLYGSSSDGCCPACKTPCSLVTGDLCRSPRPSPTEKGPGTSNRPFMLLLLDSPRLPKIQPAPPPTPRTPSTCFDETLGKTITFDVPCIGPFFYSSNTLIVLLSRMIGRILSIIGLTLFLLVLFA